MAKLKTGGPLNSMWAGDQKYIFNESTGVQNPRRPVIAISMQDTSGGGGVGGGGMVSPTALSKIMHASAVYNLH